MSYAIALGDRRSCRGARWRTISSGERRSATSTSSAWPPGALCENSLLSPERAGEPAAGRERRSLASNDLVAAPATPRRSITGNRIRELLAPEQAIFVSGTGNCVHRTGSTQLATALCRRRRRTPARPGVHVVQGELISARAVMVTWLNAGHDHPTRRHHGEQARLPEWLSGAAIHAVQSIALPTLRRP